MGQFTSEVSKVGSDPTKATFFSWSLIVRRATWCSLSVVAISSR